jgi:hypothetical protein
MPRDPATGRRICYYFNHTGCTAGLRCAYMHVKVRVRRGRREGRREGRRGFCLPPGFRAHLQTLPPSPLSLPPSRPLSRWTFPSSIPARSTNPWCARPPPPPAFPPAFPPSFPLAAPSILFSLRGSRTNRATRIFPPSLSVRLQPLSLRLFLLLFLLTSGPVLLLVFLMLLAL